MMVLQLFKVNYHFVLFQIMWARMLVLKQLEKNFQRVPPEQILGEYELGKRYDTMLKRRFDAATGCDPIQEYIRDPLTDHQKKIRKVVEKAVEV